MNSGSVWVDWLFVDISGAETTLLEQAYNGVVACIDGTEGCVITSVETWGNGIEDCINGVEECANDVEALADGVENCVDGGRGCVDGAGSCVVGGGGFVGGGGGGCVVGGGGCVDGDGGGVGGVGKCVGGGTCLWDLFSSCGSPRRKFVITAPPMPPINVHSIPFVL